MKISQLLGQMEREVIGCSTGETMAEAAMILADKRIGAMPVFDSGQVVGIVSERDILYGIANDGAAILQKTVGECMTSPAITVDQDTSVIAALGLMTRRRIRHLPVVRNGEMLGFLSIGDLVKSRMDEIAGEADAMREYIATA